MTQEKVRRDLMTGGYDPADCVLSTARELAKRARRNASVSKRRSGAARSC
jgi:hypothetical protein